MIFGPPMIRVVSLSLYFCWGWLLEVLWHASRRAEDHDALIIFGMASLKFLLLYANPTTIEASMLRCLDVESKSLNEELNEGQTGELIILV